jgi:hypothetical protein
MGDLAGFPFWELSFDESGARVAGANELLQEVPARGVTDLFVFSHGWNNDRARALRLYERFFAEVRPLLDRSPPENRSFGVAGIIWPSMRWVDEQVPAEAEGGAAAFGEAAPSEREVVESLKAVYSGEHEQAALDELADLLENRPADSAELERFQTLLGRLAAGPDAAAESEEDNFEGELVQGDPKTVFRRAARAAEEGPGDAGPDEGGAAVFDSGGAAGLMDDWQRIWEGAKQALRQTTYWTMKKRAGFVGKDGLGPLLSELHTRSPELRVHLIGHSFGARLVSFSLTALEGDVSPVKSLLLIQGAFSHYAFADSLPHAPARSGVLSGMAQRVDGPIVVTHSVFDSAVGRFYPMGSLAAGDDAAAVDEWMKRWGAMGHDGAQAVDAADVQLGDVDTPYELAPHRFLNLDADGVIKQGRPPSGAHSDIFHPELAWACLAAAGAA